MYPPTVCIGFLTKVGKSLQEQGKDPLAIGKKSLEVELIKECKKAKDKDERFVSPPPLLSGMIINYHPLITYFRTRGFCWVKCIFVGFLSDKTMQCW